MDLTASIESHFIRLYLCGTENNISHHGRKKQMGEIINSMFIFGFSFDLNDKVTLQIFYFTELNTLLGKKLILFV